MTQWGNDRPQSDEPSWDLPSSRPAAPGSPGWPTYDHYAQPTAWNAYAQGQPPPVLSRQKTIALLTALLAAAAIGFLFLPWLAASSNAETSFAGNGGGGSNDAFSQGLTVVWAVLLIVAAAVTGVSAVASAVTGSRLWSRVTMIAATGLAAFTLAEFAYVKGLLDLLSAALKAQTSGSGVSVSLSLDVGGWLTLIAALLALACALVGIAGSRSDSGRREPQRGPYQQGPTYPAGPTTYPAGPTYPPGPRG